MAANPFDLSGKVAVITGANAGIGFGYAEAIARAGGDVAIWGRRSDRNEEAAHKLAQYGGRVLTSALDVSDEAAQMRAFDQVMAEFGRIDCAIANAGFVTLAPILEMTTKQYAELVDVAQQAAFVTLREGARRMVARAEAGEAGGSLIATGSLTNFAATPGIAHYAAAKCGVAGLIRTFALELGRYGIRANMICAGLIESEMVPFGPDSAMGREAGQKVPIGRMGTPADLGGIVVYLMSDASAYHSGDLITVDGGRMINGT